MIWRFAGRRRDFAVEGHRGFQRDQRRAVSDVAGEAFVQSSSFFFEESDFDFDACGAEFFESESAHLRIGIGHGRDHTLDSGGDQSVRTGRGPALMGVGLEVDVEGRAPSFLSGGCESEDFGVLQAGVGVGSGANYFAMRVGDHRADVRIG